MILLYQSKIACVAPVRGDATGTAGTATAVPNISQISSGLERVFYFVGHGNNFVGFQSYIFCLNSSSDKEYGLETRRDYSRDRRARYYPCYYEGAIYDVRDQLLTVFT